MFSKILIANRGEIACRIIRTAKKMAISTVAVFSDADRQSPHVLLADEAVHIGNSPSSESYLCVDKIVQAAISTQADAIHPGYGFLSENADLARACADNNIVFIGPPTSAIESMGSKSAAKQIMAEAQVPLVPGYHEAKQDREVLHEAADKIGYPVLLKAVAGGGGKGMRRVDATEEFDAALDAAKREAMNGFGDDKMLVEKYILQPRHVEIQVFCDNFGNAVHLFERDCSIQRRHQKVIEEAPAPGITDALREQMGQAAIRCAKAIDYRGAGTVEFLLDASGNFYFMEMNTRLQVEHPVTEFISGQDLVEWQLRVAANEPLPASQSDLSINGHAIEARIYAEDPDNEFLPATGLISYFSHADESPNLRVDTGVTQGSEVSIYYDPMLAKLIVWGETRTEAIARLSEALTHFKLGGIKNNIAFLHRVIDTEAFANAELETGFLDNNHDAIFVSNKNQDDSHQRLADQFVPHVAAYLNLAKQLSAKEKKSNIDRTSPWSIANSWRLNAAAQSRLKITIDSHIIDVLVEDLTKQEEGHFIILHKGEKVDVYAQLDAPSLSITINGRRETVTVVQHPEGYQLLSRNHSLVFDRYSEDFECNEDGGDEQIIAPMNGRVVSLVVDTNKSLKKGDPVIVVEAMKMEHTLLAPADGHIVEFYYQAGDLVEGNATLAQFEALN